MNSQDSWLTPNVGQIHVSDLDDFVWEINNTDGLSPWQAINRVTDFSLSFDTQVDETLDPFSDEYFEQQIKLYEEISGRSLNQQKGEQYIFDVDARVKSVNPHNTEDINFMSKDVRAVTTALYMANLPPGSRVLDMGSGCGLSSEIFAFCAANVTCVDINPLYVELNQQRASRLNLPIKAQLSEFDNYQSEELYDLIFFYGCLHHAIKPWETLENLTKYLKPDGKIVFVGEPINDIYWKNWGIRLDASSAYCIRKCGWFESGWSKSFLTQAFEHAGLNLHMYHDVGLDNGIIGLATKSTNPAKPEEAFNLDPTNLSREYTAVSRSYHTLAEQHHTLAEQHHTLAEQHHALSKQYNMLINSRLFRFQKKVCELLNLSPK